MRTDDRRKTRGHYAATTEQYRDHWAPVLLSFASPLLDALPLPPAGATQPGARGLDLGCGPGAVIAAILERAANRVTMTGADLVPEMLARANRHLPGSDFVRVDAPRLPFRDRIFDFALATFMLQHVREQRRTLAEVFRVLKPGAVFLSATWGRNDAGCGAFDVWEEILTEFGAPAADPDPPRRWDEGIDTPDAIRSLILSAGFVVSSLNPTTPSWTWTPESLEGVRRSLGGPGRRFRVLPPGKQAALLKEARRRLRALEAEDFVWEPEVTLTVAVRNEAGSED